MYRHATHILPKFRRNSYLRRNDGVTGYFLPNLVILADFAYNASAYRKLVSAVRLDSCAAGAGWKCSRFTQRMVTMTTLILLCLALIGASVFLFASQQVRAQIVGGLSLKLLCLVMIGCMILPASQARAESLIDSCFSMADRGGLNVKSFYKEWQELDCASVLLEAQDTGEYDSVRSQYCREKWDTPEVLESIGASNARSWLSLCEEDRAKDIVRRVEEFATRLIKIPAKAEEALRGFKKSVEDLWVALKGDKRYCDVLLNGTVLLGEIEEHNERGLGAAVEGARFSDGRLRGILEVAKQGCNPE